MTNLGFLWGFVFLMSIVWIVSGNIVIGNIYLATSFVINGLMFISEK